ncbi:Armadillo repeat-containing kinesin-like protein 3 [Diplonema papillatum]|nr:Armadillo repeat-containing kinesin-like protein 3 [Diplonema papillatum]
MPDEPPPADVEGEKSASDEARKHGESLVKDTNAKEEGSKKSKDNRVTVFARLRPVFKRDKEDPSFEHIVKLHPDKKSISLTGGTTYVYDGTYGEDSEQIPVWESVAKPVVENVFKGYSGCVMAYGQTGTGKSHTMSNCERGQEGIIMQSMDHIFKTAAADPDRDYECSMGYLQIYLDKVQDLLNPESGNLDISKSETGEVQVNGLCTKQCNTREEFIELYQSGDQHRIVAATKMNPVSSRSHSCLMIRIVSRPKGDDGTGESRTAKMWLIDLAGYEQFSKTGITKGIRAQEAKSINASLLALGNVVQALSERAPHKPWRNAKLTRLLEDAIGGKAKASVCITIQASGVCFHETVQTLRFGSRAMAVKTEAKIERNINYEALCQKLQGLLEEEQEKVSALEIQVTARQVESQEREDRMQREIRRLKQKHEEQLRILIQSGADPTAIEAMIKENEAEMEVVQEQHAEERQLEEEKYEEEVLSVAKEGEKVSHAEMDKINVARKAEIAEIESKLTSATEEVERLKKKEQECEQLNQYITQLKEEHTQETLRIKEETALNSGVSQDGLEQLKQEYDKQVRSIRAMMETTHEGRMLELQERHEGELKKLRSQMEDSNRHAEEEYAQMKSSLERKMDDEIAKIKAKAADVQEKLKRNHTIIKNSYQEQKEKLKAEIKVLKDQHEEHTEGMASEGKDNLRTLADQHRTIKKSYQEQIEKLKAENAALQARHGTNGTSGTAHVDPASSVASKAPATTTAAAVADDE